MTEPETPDERVAQLERTVVRLEKIARGRHRQRIILYSGLALILAGIFFQSYNGRETVVTSQRTQCLRFAKAVVVPLANSLRADADGNAAIASDPRQSSATRSARSVEAQIERTSLTAFDRRLDPRIIGELNPKGKWIVHWLVQHHQAFSCDQAYPAASPVQFIN